MKRWARECNIISTLAPRIKMAVIILQCVSLVVSIAQAIVLVKLLRHMRQPDVQKALRRLGQGAGQSPASFGAAGQSPAIGEDE